MCFATLFLVCLKKYYYNSNFFAENNLKDVLLIIVNNYLAHRTDESWHGYLNHNDFSIETKATVLRIVNYVLLH